jgi:hypothetical protein
VYRSRGSLADRDAARMARIEKLRKLLEGGPVRLRPLPGRTIARRRELTFSLQKAMMAQRQDLLGRRAAGVD